MQATLIIVALIAGLATFLSPCVLPMVPVIAAAGATGGRRRPLGIAAGLLVAFVVFTLTASRLLSALGLPQDLLENLAIAMLAVVGAGLLVPALGERLGRIFVPLAARFAPSAQGRDGFWSGVGLGAALALVWTPCAGPILAAVTVLSAERQLSLELVLITTAYALGATLPLFGVALLGNRAAASLAGLRSHGPAVRRVAGAVLLVAAALFTTDIPTRLAANVPSYVSSLQSLERSQSVHHDLLDLAGTEHSSTAALAASNHPGQLHNYGKAPGFHDIAAWLNTPGGHALTDSQLRGKVVLVDFWTYSCVNCVRTLPYLKAWYQRYHARGLVIVGVHTPEFAFEHSISNVRRAVAEHGLHYPVAIDNDYGTWNAFANEYWPADYLIDRRGDIREAHFGEGDYAGTEADIRKLLGESAAAPVKPHALTASQLVNTPETYLGTYRAAGYVQTLQPGKMAHYTSPGVIEPDQVVLTGDWLVQQHQITAGRNAVLEFSYVAPRIYLVAAPPPGRTVKLGVSVDGARLAPVAVSHDDLYQLADLPSQIAKARTLHLNVPPGTTLYSFTFG